MTWIQLIALILLIVLIVLLIGRELFFSIWYDVIKPKFRKKIRNKSDLAEHYGVSRPTLQKWVEHFAPAWLGKIYSTVRNVDEKMACLLSYFWGIDYLMVKTKQQMIDDMEMVYHRTLRENVGLNFVSIGISKEVFRNCTKFPPSISTKIMAALG